MRTTSQKYSLMDEDKKKWIRNQLEFLKPLIAYVGLIYLAPILAILQVENHIVTLQDFIPSSAVVTAITLYLTFGTYDLFRKWAR